MCPKRMVSIAALVGGVALATLPAAAQQHPVPPPPPRPPTPAPLPVHERGWLGFAYHAERVSFVHRGETPAPEEKISVGEVLKGSPADRAGLEPGDTVLKVNGETASVAAISRVVRRLQPGDKVQLQVRRAGRTHDLTLVAAKRPDYVEMPMEEGMFRVRVDGDSIRRTMRIFMDSARVAMDSLHNMHIERHDSTIVMQWGGGRRPDTIHLPGMETMRGAWRSADSSFHAWGSGNMPVFDVEIMGRSAIAGARLQELNEQLAAYFGVKEGLLVERVTEGTPAARAGLRAGDVLTAANGRALGDMADLRRALRGREGTVKLDLERKGKHETVQLKWP